MANWAIVIGINQYQDPKMNLRGAVQDALHMLAWLTDSGGGAVPKDNVVLLLRPSPDSTHAPPGISILDAVQDNIVKAVKWLLQKSKGQAECFFFYYAGHGLSTKIDGRREDGLAPADFTKDYTYKALEINSLFELFRAAQFRKQFFFIDACRNIPWEKPFHITPWPWPEELDPAKGAVDQFVCYATSPGVKAFENNEHGAFTEALLAGLRGQGTAKTWDWANDKYIVRWDSLFAFVEREVTGKKLAADDERSGQLIQVPSQAGERSSSNPILAYFTEQDFPAESLAVNLDPAVQGAEVLISDTDKITRKETATILPLRLSLPPRNYRVSALAPGYRPQPQRREVSLYAAQEITIQLVLTSLEGSTAATHVEQLGFESRSRDLGQADKVASLSVAASDPLALLEIIDGSGEVLAIGQANLEIPSLPPGFYRVRLRTPEFKVSEQSVDLAWGENEVVKLTGPELPTSEVLAAVISHSQAYIDPAANTLDISETVGPMVAAQLSTLLILAANVVNKNKKWGHRLRELQLKSFREMTPWGTASGVQLLIGDESVSAGAVSSLATMQVQLWPQQSATAPKQELPPAQLVEGLAGLAQFAAAANPGPYWLALGLSEQRPLLLAAQILPHRLTTFVIERNPSGELAIYQYLPIYAPEPDAQVDEPVATLANLAANDRSEEYERSVEKARANLLRQLELMQRFWMAGHIEHACRYAVELLDAGWQEPIAALLGGYLLLKLGNFDKLESVVGWMGEHFSELSDTHVLRAACAINRNEDDTAVAAFQTALDSGLPLCAEGLARLYSGVERYRIQHRQVDFIQDVFKNRLPGLLWTAVPMTENNAHLFAGAGIVTSNQSGGINLGAGAHLQAENVAGRDLRIAGKTYIEVRDHAQAQLTYYQAAPGAEEPLRLFDELRAALDGLDLPTYEKRKVQLNIEGARLEAEVAHKSEAAESLKQAAALIRALAPTILGATEFGRLLRACLHWAGQDESGPAQ